MINEPREIKEPIGKAGMQQLSTDVWHWLAKPRKEGKFGFIDVLKIIIIVLTISGIAYFTWWLWRQLALAFGRVL
jgi:hypothetical protein